LTTGILDEGYSRKLDIVNSVSIGKAMHVYHLQQLLLWVRQRVKIEFELHKVDGICKINSTVFCW